MNLRISDDLVESVVHKAILESIDAQQRDELIKAAIQHLITPKQEYTTGPRVSPLQKAFFQAVDDYARKVVAEKLADGGPWQQEIDALLEQTLKTFTTQHRAKSAEKLAEHLGRLMTGERY